MRKTLSVMFSSHLLLLSVLLSPLWGVDVNVSSTTATTKVTKVESSTGGKTTTAMLTSTMTTAKPPPKNVEEVKVEGQNETSITLKWDKVDNISTYTLKYYNNGNMTENINASLPETSVHYQVTSLTAGTKYNFTLFTVFEEEESSGFLFLAVTAPKNVEEVTVEGQNETSITLMWNKVDHISTYTLKYYNNGNMKTENINASLPETSVHYQVTSLTAGTKYNFTLFTVFEEEESSGFLFLAVTAPKNVEEVKVEGQNETSITLKWDKVDNISKYTLKYYNNGNMKTENINASLPETSVHYQVTSLTAGTKYNFTLFTVFEEEESSGFLFLAVTAPKNVEEVMVEGQNETSITLMWNKVDNISTYTLKYYNNGNMKTENINPSLPETSVHYQVTSLTAGTKYNFTLFTVFEEDESSGFLFLAVTAPKNVEEVTVEGQNETSITLMWNKVDNISKYTLKYYNNGNMKTENINASLPETSVHYQVTSLTAGTKYNFTLFTVFEEEESSGFLFLAVTAPKNVEEVKVEGQNETSITLMWNKVDNISKYTLKYYNNGNMKTENINASLPETSVHYQVTSLTAGTKYNFTLFTVFEEEESSGFLFLAVTAPKNVEEVTVEGQNETSITLMWNKVDNISTYTLKYYNNGNMKTENINASLPETSVHYQVTSLTAGTKYNFTLFTVFEEEESSGFLFLAVTAPKNVEEVTVEGQNETSITLMWNKVDHISTYTLKYYNNGNMKTENINASLSEQRVHYQVTSLTAGTKYNFTLFTVFEEEESSGFLFLAVTAPKNVEEVTVEGQNETSITLKWNKVDNISTYTLKYYNNGNMKTENINASLSETSVHYQVTSLTAGTKYNFTLFTVFEEEESSGFLFLAVTAPKNVEEVTVEGQNETSITLKWNKVDNISTYTLKYYNNGNMKTENINASLPETSVHYQVTSLTAGTKYNFTLFTVFEEEESSGFLFLAVTAPKNVEEVKVEGQNETSITLMWNKVDHISTYTLKYYNNGNMKTENINASLSEQRVHYQVTSLTAGTKYNFTLFTVFEEDESSGFLFLAVTAPKNVEEVTVEGQNETSITLMWNKVDNISKYTLKYYNNGNMKTENINASLPETSVHYQVTSLTAGTKYNFTLFTVFEEEESSGFLFLAVTAPKNVEEVKVEGQNETSITLMWNKVDHISTYTLKYYNNGNMKTENINASLPETSVHYQVTSLTAGTKYNFTLFTVFEEEESSGFLFLAVTVPSRVTSVQVTERSLTHLTLAWEVDVNKDWSYFLQINDEHLQLQTDKSRTIMSHPVTSLQPGTKYSFSLITSFSQLNSTAYEDFTVTAINCDVGMWRVTNSSIRGEIEGLFTNATATNKSRDHQSAGGRNVSFTDLYPGATYEVSLEYEDGSRSFQQCNLSLTLIPPDLSASCRYRAGGHAIVILWDKPEGVWKEVEVNVTGRTYRTAGDEKQNIQISGLQPARAYQVSVATLVGSVRSSDPFIFSCSTDPRGVIAGSVFAVLLFVALVCVVVYIVLKRPDFFSKKMSLIFGSKQTKRKLKPVPVAKFPDHFYQLSGDENRGLSEEYEDLKPVGTEQSQKEAFFPQNKAKNRFSNVLPYDWCRVKLTSADPSTTSDYINASYMPGYDSSREYIATQGPLPTTVNDFWRMIWEQRVRGIVMVTNCSEGGRTKCERYWPTEKESCLYGNLLVTVRAEQQEPNWTLRNFTVQHSKTSGEFKVKHFHFTAWPDHGVPQSTEVLIQFRELVREHIQRLRTPAPTVVHCSAGVGRTGTIIALDVLLQQLEKDQAVGVNGFVQKMRLSRPHMVQTESQYVFLHQCLLDRLQSDTKAEENIYENSDMIYANATALRDFSQA